MQKGSVLPIILVILIIAGVIVGFLYFNQSTPPPQVQPVEQKDTLKIYSNEKLGFGFQYDKGLEVQEDSEEEFNKRGNGDFRKNFTYYVTYSPAKVLGAVVVLDKTNSYDTNPLTVWVFENPNDLTIEKWYANFWYYPFVWGDYTERRFIVAPINEATISGQIAKYGVINYQPSQPKFIYLSKDKKMFLFRIIGERGDQILATFKFLSSNKNTGCLVTGCNGQVCADEEAITTCEWREEYGCYKNGRCKRQTNGKCGWTQTEELKRCLEEKSNIQPKSLQ